MKLFLSVMAILLLVIAIPAFADQTSGGSTTVGPITNTNTANGGVGGAGGNATGGNATGGSATGGSVNNTTTVNPVNIVAPVFTPTNNVSVDPKITATGGSVTDNSKTTNTNTNIVAPVANGGSVKDSGNSSSSSKVENSGNSNNRNTNNNNASVKNSGNSNQRQGQQQGQQQGQTQSANNGGQQNAQNLNIVTEIPHQAPSISAPEAFSTANCRVAFSAGGAGPLGGFSFGSSKLDEGCALARSMVNALALGKPKMALHAYCSDPTNKKIYGGVEKCEAAAAKE